MIQQGNILKKSCGGIYKIHVDQPTCSKKSKNRKYNREDPEDLRLCVMVNNLSKMCTFNNTNFNNTNVFEVVVKNDSLLKVVLLTVYKYIGH